jgi:SAM-dependent methyltransferase
LPGDLPLLIHTHHNRYLEDIPYWSALADRQGGAVLELGCGGGRVLLRLAAAGQLAVGLDSDREMLEILQGSTPPELSSLAAAFQADMAYFSLKRPFPLILLTCNTLSALSDPARPVVYGRIAAHLSPGGVFAASLPNPEIMRALPSSGDAEPEDDFPHPKTGNPVQVSSAWSNAQDRLEVRWYYDHLYPDGTVLRSSATVAHSLASLEQYSEELSAAGLRIVEAQGDFDGSPYQPDSPFLILTCRTG